MKKIDVFDYAADILKAVKTGVLLTTSYQGRVNTMTISWGTLGIEWSKPIFTTFVRENRYTKTLLDGSGEFTINIPQGEYDRKILGACGTLSGRNADKIKRLGLTLVPSEFVAAPGIKEFPITLECRVVYKQKQDPDQITPENQRAFYPQDVSSENPGSNRDYHTAYYGEIVNAYLIEP